MNWIKKTWLKYFKMHTDRNMILFGVLLCALLIILLMLKPHNLLVFSILISVQLLGIIFKQILRTEFATFTLLTLPIGYILSYLVLGAFFYLIITPIGVFRKRKYKASWKKSVVNIDKNKLYE